MGIDMDNNRLTPGNEVRRQAEEQVRTKLDERHAPRTEAETHRLLHELEVHQLELEMQNAELRRAREELEVALAKYAELYDFAPIGYFTFDAGGLIREVNLTGAQLLGVERRRLVDQAFSTFIDDADERALFSRHLEKVLQRQGIQKCEISFTGKDGTLIHGQLQSVAVATPDDQGVYILTQLSQARTTNKYLK